MDVEPHLQPIAGEQFTLASSNIKDGTRLDISANGFWGGRCEKTYIDVKVFNPHAPSYRTTSASAIYRKHELCKKCSYEARIREVEQSSFIPLIFSATGGMANEADIPTFWNGTGRNNPIVPPTASFGDVVTTPASLDPIVTSTASPDVGAPASPDVVTPAPSSSVTVDTSAVPECSSILTCPICTKSYSSCSLLWQHINSVHISRAVFPPAAFFAKCNHLICSVPSCHWASHDRYRKTGCRCLLKPGQHCNAPLVSASDLPAVFSIQLPPSS